MYPFGDSNMRFVRVKELHNYENETNKNRELQLSCVEL